MTGADVLFAMFSYLAAQVAQSMLTDEPEQPLVEEKPGTTSTQGSYVPLLIGRRRIGPVIGWVGDRFSTTETGSSGGKGSGGGAVEQTVYFESAWHQLCVGPARKLRKIWVNGKIVWSSGGITPESHPSGSTVSLDDHDGSFTIYWGHNAQPVDSYITAANRVGVPSRWPNCCWVRLNSFRLGGFAVWQLVEYEIEVHPLRQGDDHGADYASLPARLTQSNDWYANQHGVQVPWREILDVQASSPTWIKVADTDGSVAASFPADSRSRIRFQPLAFVNGDYIVASAVWNSGEQIVVLDGTYADATGYNKNVTAWSLATSNTLAVVALTGPAYPPVPPGYTVQDRYLLSSGTDLAIPGAVTYDMTGAGDLFSRGANRMRVWVHGLGMSGDIYAVGRPPSAWVIIGFTGRSGANTNSHTARFEVLNGGNIDIQNSNGAIGTVLLDYGEWRLLQVEYVAGAGNDPSDETWERDLQILWAADSSNALFTYLNAANDEYLVDEDDGALVTGVTQITLKQTIADLQPQLGDIAPLVRGLGPAEGANPAHILHQLLFASWPHGAGLDESEFDIESLEAVGVALGDQGEGYRAHVVGLGGQNMEGLIGSVLQDCGIAISWDVATGLYRFELVRQEDIATVLGIPADAIVDPLPEIDSRHEARTATAMTFGFPSIGQNYRDAAISFVDDGEATRRFVQVRENVPIKTATDSETAAQAGLRRAQLDLSAPTAYRIRSAWEARKLWVGRPIKILGMDVRGIPSDQVMRVAEIKLNALTSLVELNVVTDVYGISTVAQGGASPLSSPGTSWSPDVQTDFEEQVAAADPPADASFAVHELSAYVSPESIAFVVPRLRGSRAVVSANIHLSLDGFTYRALGNQQVYAGGGTLLEDMPEGRWYCDEGPLLRDDSGDIAQFAEQLSDAEWAAGRVVALIGGEVMFPGILQAVGGSLWRMRRILRGRYEFGQSAHVAGDRVFIFRQDRTPVWRDVMLSPGRSVWVKTQPRAGTSAHLDDLAAVSAAIVGRPKIPMGPTNFRTARLSPSYRTGEGVSFKWGYRSRHSLKNLSGYGCQRYGTAMGLPPPVEGEFRLEIYDTTPALVRTIWTSGTSYTYSNADIIADLGAEENFTAKLLQRWGKRNSQELSLEIELV